ncbi:MAG TPA: DNA polymerase III subunit delta [Bacteroidota bacterium]|nr:DNA polymerase III subunit delta [Bacteroidota bacterium]
MAKAPKEKLDADGIIADIRAGKFAPVYFFYGEEDYFIEGIIDAIVKYGVDESTKQFNCDIVHGSDSDGKTVGSMAMAYPMMADRRVVVVKEFDKLAEKERLESYFENPSPTTVMVLTALSPDMRKKPFPLLKKHSVGGEAARLYDNQVPAWIESHVKKRKKSISSQAAALLQSYVGSSLRELANEIEKLLISIGTKDAIDAADVERVVGVSREFTVFELSNAVGERNIKRAVEITERILDMGGSSVPIIAALTQHFIKLWKLTDARRLGKSDYETASAAGIVPFFLQQYLRQLQRYSVTEIENAFCILAKADEQVKSSQNSDKMILSVALSEIMIKPSVH